MKAKVLQIIGLAILITGLLLGFTQEGFCVSVPTGASNFRLISNNCVWTSVVEYGDVTLGADVTYTEVSGPQDGPGSTSFGISYQYRRSDSETWTDISIGPSMGNLGQFTIQLQSGTYYFRLVTTTVTNEEVVSESTLGPIGPVYVCPHASIEGGNIRGVVTDQGGAPVEGAAVEYSDGTGTASTHTNTQGEYASWAATGTYTLKASKAGYRESTQNITVANNDITVNFSLTPSQYTISGTVTGPSGLAVSGATITISGPTSASHTTGSDGKYTQKVDNGTYTVKASKEGYTEKSQEVTVSNGDVTCDFTLDYKKTIVYVPSVVGDSGTWVNYPEKVGKQEEYNYYPYNYSGTSKTLKEYGDDLNKFIQDKNINGELIILTHSFGGLITRAAVIKAVENTVNNNSTGKPLYDNVRIIQVAPMIGGDGKAWGHWIVGMISNITANMDPVGETQEWLYGEGGIGNPKFEQGIGTEGRNDIILIHNDSRAPPAQYQLSNPGLGAGLKEDSDGVPFIIESDLTEPHKDIINVNEVKCKVYGEPLAETLKPWVAVKEVDFTEDGDAGEIKLTLFNLGTRADSVRVKLSISHPSITVTKDESIYGAIESGKSADNSSDKFILTIHGNSDQFSMAEITFKITTTDASGKTYERTFSDTISMGDLEAAWFKSAKSILPAAVKFAKNILDYIVTLGGSHPVAEAATVQVSSGPALADLDKDGFMEIIFPVSSRELRVLKSDGNDFWPAPYTVNDSRCTALYPVAADINNDGETEIILAEYGAGILRILDKNGSLLHFISGVNAGMPVVADIDNAGDGKMEIVTAKDGVVTMLDADGRIIWSNDDLAGYTPATASPVLIDLNNDGKKEIITGDVCVLDKDGNILSKKTAVGERGASVADIDNDGKPEIVTGRIFKVAGNNPSDILEEGMSLFEESTDYPPVIADLDGDDSLEVLNLTKGGDLEVYYNITSNSYRVASFDYLSSFMYEGVEAQYYPISLYDMDGDGELEIVLSAGTETLGRLYFLGLLDHVLDLGYTYDTAFKLTHAPVLADIDKDGIVELIAGDTASASNNSISLFKAGESSPGTIFWPQFQRDSLRTGFYDAEPPQLSAIGNKGVNEGASLSFNISASSQMVGKLSFCAYPLPEGAALVNNGDGRATFSWTPTHNQVGTYALTFAVNDGAYTVMQAVSISVTGIPPSAPTDLAITAVSTSSINLSWSDNSSNETGFKVERSTNNSSFTQIATLASNVKTYSDTGLAETATYYYRVKAYSNIGDSSYSSTASATTLFAAPTNLTATTKSTTSIIKSTTYITLTWTDNSSVEDGFSLEYSTDGVNYFGLAAPAKNATSYSATRGIVPGYRYYFRLRAYKTTYPNPTYSDYSNIADAATYLSGAPSGLTATAVSGKKITLKWTDNSNNETGFKIERSTSPISGFTQVATTTANTTTYTNTGLTSGKIYYYRVRAYSSTLGNSSYSNTAPARAVQ